MKKAKHWIVVVVFLLLQVLAGAALVTQSAQGITPEIERVTETGIASGTAVIGEASGGIKPEDIARPGRSWLPPEGRVFNAVIAHGAYVYVIGGTSDGGGNVPTSTNFRYNTSDNTWKTMTAMPAALDSIDGAVIGGKIYIPGDGSDSNTYVYDIAADIWTYIQANGGYSGRSQYQVVAIGTDLYVLGGLVGSSSTTEV